MLFTRRALERLQDITSLFFDWSGTPQLVSIAVGVGGEEKDGVEKENP